MENKTLLLGLIKSKFGTFVAQSCVPLFETTTINFVVNSLLGHMVTLSSNKSGSFFIQSFLAHWAHHPSLDLLVELLLQGRVSWGLVAELAVVAGSTTILGVLGDPEVCMYVCIYVGSYLVLLR